MISLKSYYNTEINQTFYLDKNLFYNNHAFTRGSSIYWLNQPSYLSNKNYIYSRNPYETEFANNEGQIFATNNENFNYFKQKSGFVNKYFKNKSK